MFPLNAAANIVPIFKEYKSNTPLAIMIADTIHITVSKKKIQEYYFLVANQALKLLKLCILVF